MSDTDKLIKLLGSESGDKWLEFMDYVNQNLSHILKRGKPRIQDIENSIIGKSGFKTWKDFIESSTQTGGLGWKIATFDSWKRAYSIVCNYEFLRDLELSASFINTIYRETKPNFPKTESEFNEFLALREHTAIAKQQNMLKVAENRAEELTSENNTLINKSNIQEVQIENLKKLLEKSEALNDKLLVAEKRVSQLEAFLEISQKDLISAKKISNTKSARLETLDKYEDMSLFKKILSHFD